MLKIKSSRKASEVEGHVINITSSEITFVVSLLREELSKRLYTKHLSSHHNNPDKVSSIIILLSLTSNQAESGQGMVSKSSEKCEKLPLFSLKVFVARIT